MLKDFNSVELDDYARGGIVKSKGAGTYAKIYYVGENRLVFSDWHNTIEGAEKTEYYSAYGYDQVDINRNELSLISRRPLNVTDRSGHTLRVFDEVKRTHHDNKAYLILSAMKSLKTNKTNDPDYLIIKDDGAESGWATINKKSVIYHSTPLHSNNKTESIKKEIENICRECIKSENILINGAAWKEITDKLYDFFEKREKKAMEDKAI